MSHANEDSEPMVFDPWDIFCNAQNNDVSASPVSRSYFIIKLGSDGSVMQ